MSFPPASNIPAGISLAAIGQIPPQWNAQWFANFVAQFLQPADIRNAQSADGSITISGTTAGAVRPLTGSVIGSVGNIQIGSTIKDLFNEPYTLWEAPSDSALTNYQVLTPQSGVLAITSGGAKGDLTLRVAANGIGNTQLRQGGALTVVGNSTGGTANVADISMTTLAGMLATFPAVAGAVTLTVDGASSEWALQVNGNSASADSFGILVESGTTSADYCARFLSQTGGTNFLSVYGDGGIGVGSVSGSPGAGILNATNGLQVNGVNVSTAAGANPSASVGLAAVDGSSTSFMRADGAPALSQAIAPTWTKLHTWNVGDGDNAITLGTTGDTDGIALEFQYDSTSVAGWIGNGPSNFTGAAIGDFGINCYGGTLRLGYGGSGATAISVAPTTGLVTVSTAFETKADLGFYGTTPIAQRATTSTQKTSNLKTATTSASFGSVQATDFNAAVVALQEVMNTLAAYGLWAGS